MSETKPVTLWRCCCDSGDQSQPRWIPDETDEDSTLDEQYRALPAAEFEALLARLKAAEDERDAAITLLKEARDALTFYASGHPNAFRCASERMGIGQGPCCERVIDAGGIAQQALDKIRALLGPAHDATNTTDGGE